MLHEPFHDVLWPKGAAAPTPCELYLRGLLSLNNCRYRDQRFPLDLPPSSPEQPQEEEETIVIEHKSLEELNAASRGFRAGTLGCRYQ